MDSLESCRLCRCRWSPDVSRPPQPVFCIGNYFLCKECYLIDLELRRQEIRSAAPSGASSSDVKELERLRLLVSDLGEAKGSLFISPFSIGIDLADRVCEDLGLRKRSLHFELADGSGFEPAEKGEILRQMSLRRAGAASRSELALKSGCLGMLGLLLLAWMTWIICRWLQGAT